MEGATRAWRLMRPTLAERAPTVTATLADGPMAGRSIETGVIEGRPPKVIDVPIDNGSCRYCLAQWAQSGPSAIYTFLFEEPGTTTRLLDVNRDTE